MLADLACRIEDLGIVLQAATTSFSTGVPTIMNDYATGALRLKVGARRSHWPAFERG